MRVEFLTLLRVELQASGRWRLLAPFAARVDGAPIVAPEGFETDFDSVPRLPLAYMLLGNSGLRAAALHDYLYSAQCAPRVPRARRRDLPRRDEGRRRVELGRASQVPGRAPGRRRALPGRGLAVIEAAIAGVGILIGLNGAILAYVISIERRLTRLETFQEVRRAPRPAVQ